MTARAMILAAGRGERMRPLTDHTPKPLLTVRGKPLMQWPMESLARAGFDELVINTAWLGEKIQRHFGPQRLVDGRWPLSISYSDEARDFGGALETAGGIVRALPLLDEVFWVAAGDVFAPEFAFARDDYERFARSDWLAHLWLVDNPPHNPAGDFGLAPDGRALAEADRKLTFSTIALYKKAFFAPPFCDLASGNPAGERAALAPMLRAAMQQGRVGATHYAGAWTDVGTPERLAAIDRG